MIEPINSVLLHKEVQQRIKQYILSNALQWGDRLPTETEFADMLHVSRNVVREAMKGLETIGVIEIRRGAGTRVAQFDAKEYLDHFAYNLIVQGISLRELWVVRGRLEIAFVEEAASAIGEDDLAELDRILGEMETSLATGLSTPSLGLRIHQVMFRCLDNRVLNGLLDAFAKLWAQVGKDIFASYSHELLTEDLAAHRRIVQALRCHDALAARKVLEECFAPPPPLERYPPTFKHLNGSRSGSSRSGAGTSREGGDRSH
jgi:DNA-binding FadR family transcriptional regulator